AGLPAPSRVPSGAPGGRRAAPRRRPRRGASCPRGRPRSRSPTPSPAPPYTAMSVPPERPEEPPQYTKYRARPPPFDPGGAAPALVLGSDQRPKGTHEGGASTSGPSRSDSILLMRVGGGHAGRLSIPRDTVVDIPGHGRNKINAAYAFGGAALAIKSVEQLLG